MPGPLARRYRRLLFAYPRAYRRSRGDELVGALLDAARPGRTRPTVREAANLIRHGLRARLGRPASRTVVAWAVLTAVISGLFVAAFATRVAWETARPLPRVAETRAMLAQILPGQEFDGIEDAPAMFIIYGQPLSWDAAGDLLFGDGNEYGLATVGGGVAGAPAFPPPETIELVQHNLRAQGWTVYPPTKQNVYDCVGPPCDPTTIPQSTTIVAERGDTTFTMEVFPEYSQDTTTLTAEFARTTPSAAYPFGFVGGILGATVAFLMFGWASRRTEGRHPARRAVKMLLAIALLFWWAPALIATPWTALYPLRESHPSWHPMWEWLGQPTFSLLFLLGAAAAMLGLALSSLPLSSLRRRDREPLSIIA